MPAPAPARPGDLLLTVPALGAVMLLLLNDHLFKGLFGNALTGKLSDVAGLFVLPMITVTVAEAARCALRRPWRTTGDEVLAHTAVAGAGFAAVKLIGPVGDAYEHAIGVLRQVLTLSAEGAPIIVYRDATDLVVLPVLVLGYLSIMRHRRPAAAGAGGGGVSRAASPRPGTPVPATAGCSAADRTPSRSGPPDRGPRCPAPHRDTR